MIIIKTPYRISFFGGGSDYPIWYNKNGGQVLSTTIDKHIYLTCRYLPRFFNHRFRIIWSKIEQVKNVNKIQHPAVKGLLKYLKVNNIPKLLIILKIRYFFLFLFSLICPIRKPKK